MTVSSSAATVRLDPTRAIGDISPLLFGGFAEHLGRCIYEGIYDPASPQADARGFRPDLMAALRELGFTTIRYPGGNFVSGYDWKDGIGPKDRRPRRRELAWQSIETNQFGTDEFMEFCRELGTEPMMGMNFGTGSIQDSADLMEYCNAPTGTKFGDLRAANGHKEPYGVKYWCLGNEMDGPWQIGHLNAVEYGKKALEAAKLLHMHDPAARLILCGSSGPGMPTYPEWDRVTLEMCWDQVDYLALHYYAENRDNDTDSFLASASVFERHVDDLAATLRYVKALKRSKKEVFLSWDEWNVWYKGDATQGNWTEAPHLLEEVYNLEDALVVAQWMSVFLRRSHVLKVACLAQIVNVIAPLLTNAESVLKQSTFWPFAWFRKYAAGVSLDAQVESPTYETKRYGAMPLLDVSASYDAATGKQALFLVNRSRDESLPLTVVWHGQAPASLDTALQLAGNDPKAANSFEKPNGVTPRTLDAIRVEDGRAELLLPPLSFTVAAG